MSAGSALLFDSQNRKVILFSNLPGFLEAIKKIHFRCLFSELIYAIMVTRTLELTMILSIYSAQTYYIQQCFI